MKLIHVKNPAHDVYQKLTFVFEDFVVMIVFALGCFRLQNFWIGFHLYEQKSAKLAVHDETER